MPAPIASASIPIASTLSMHSVSAEHFAADTPPADTRCCTSAHPIARV
jgi:hypothetical protein